ncbi:VanW family protein [Actinomyces vulturis]|uniref:VanW family protein n=1 Tax=Actinomyces vulturis TaxID=1857645 RepID=UPI00082BCD31|nr:VanW family protein [Actinomyces vulturis]
MRSFRRVCSIAGFKILALAQALGHRWHTLGRTVHVGVGVVFLFLLAYSGAAVALSGHAPANTVISGVDIGKLSKAEARQRIETELTPRLSQPLTVTAQGGSAILHPATLNLTLDTESTLSPLIDFTLNPVTLARRAFTTAHQPVRTSVDITGLHAALDADLPVLSMGVTNASVTLDHGQAIITPGSSGVGVNIPRTLGILATTWPLNATSEPQPFGDDDVSVRSGDHGIVMALPEGTVDPPITDTAAQVFVHDVVEPVLSAPITLLPPDISAGDAGQAPAALPPLMLTPDQLVSMASVHEQNNTLVLSLDTTQLGDLVSATYGDSLNMPGSNAQWAVDGGENQAPRITSGKPGRMIDLASLAQNIVIAGSTGGTDSAAQLVGAGITLDDTKANRSYESVVPGSRQVTIPLTFQAPVVSEDDLRSMGIVNIVGEYSTPFTSDPNRDKNLVQGCEQINGKIVQPGDIFSVNEALGTVDEEHGFAAAGVIVAEEHIDAMGGGLSQVGTTVFNAAYEAGMDDIEHTPHSQYISRYPEGREATIWTGEKDVKFRNSTPYPVLIQAWVENNRVNVRLWSTPYYDVSITTSERSNIIDYDTIVRSGDECYPQPDGEPGFTVTIMRKRSHDGTALPDESLTVHYNPNNVVVCQ